MRYKIQNNGFYQYNDVRKMLKCEEGVVKLI